jgi:hypothetical protein
MTDIMVVAPATRKHNCKTCPWHNRYTSNNGC